MSPLTPDDFVSQVRAHFAPLIAAEQMLGPGGDPVGRSRDPKRSGIVEDAAELRAYWVKERADGERRAWLMEQDRLAEERRHPDLIAERQAKENARAGTEMKWTRADRILQEER